MHIKIKNNNKNIYIKCCSINFAVYKTFRNVIWYELYISSYSFYCCIFRLSNLFFCVKFQVGQAGAQGFPGPPGLVGLPGIKGERGSVGSKVSYILKYS